MDRPIVVVESKEADLSALPDAPAFAAQFPADAPAEEVIARYDAHPAAARIHGDAFPKWWPNMGPSAVGGFLGARRHVSPHTVSFEPAVAAEMRDLPPTHNGDNPLWKRLQEFTRAAVAHCGSQVCVGHTDLGHNFDILAHLRANEGLLLDSYDAPDEVIRVLGEITRLCQRCYDELFEIVRATDRGTSHWASIWSPGRCYMLQCDFAYMISPAMFERFVLPCLEETCRHLDHAFYHLDGKGQIPHLDLLLSLDQLHRIQWVPGVREPPADDDRWLPLLKRIRDAVKLCELYVSAKGALEIVRELGGRGVCLSHAGRPELPRGRGFSAGARCRVKHSDRHADTRPPLWMTEQHDQDNHLR